MACLAYARITTTLEDFIEAERVAERAGTRHILTARIAQAFIHILHGETEEAETLLQRVGPETREAVPLFASTIDTTEAHLLLHKGRLAEARDMLQASGRERYRDFLPSWENTRNSALGWLHWEEGDDESALQCFEECVRHCRETDYFPFATGPLLLPLHVDTLVRRGRAQEAGELIESLAALYRSPDRFFRASLAAARFRLHLSPELAARAIEAAEAAPWPWLLGLVEYWKGEFLRDSVAAQEAHRWFAAIGAVRAAERAFSLLRRMGMVRPPRSGRSAGATLTPREQEVAALVADGLSNAAIANRLFLSRATVASHIANILAKLNFTSRSQIAAWIAEQRRLHHSPVE
jgi:DNA-binding CsgD family transcriptional regulator